MAMADGGEIFVVSGAGRGHLQPCRELCNHLISRNYHTTLVIPSSAKSPSSSFTQNPLTKILQLTASSPGPPNPGPDPLRHQAAQDLHDHLASLSDIRHAPLPLCAIIDFHMGWTKEVFWKFHVPVIGLFTFGASAASIEWGAWKVSVGDIRPDELRPIPGLPDHMALSIADLKRRPADPSRGVPNRPPGGGGGGRGRSGGGGPPKPGDRPPWVPEIEGSIALMFNTCDFIDRAFIDYMKDQMGMPVWAVGPLLPETYWNRNRNRPIEANQRQSNSTEDDVVQWLDSKPSRSVLYVAFGSEVGPNEEEYPQLASALEESNRPFIWVIQTGSGGEYNPDGLESRVGERGLIIRGWAPQQLILSHQSTGGFLSHCGWNSTVEAVCRGVAILGWPMRGDQYCNAKLVQKHLKVGYGVCESFEEMVKKEDILKGIERLMGDEDVKRRAMEIGRKFEDGFPASSAAALDDFVDFIRPKTSSQVHN